MVPGFLDAYRKAIDAQYRIRKDIHTILDAGLRQNQLALLLGVRPVSIWYWKTGRFNPKDPLIAFLIAFYADWIRQEAATDPAAPEVLKAQGIDVNANKGVV